MWAASGERSEKKDSQPLRYIAIRIEKKQGHLYDDGSRVRHFAVVTNIEEWTATKLIQWHREKAGTIEMVHDVLKNELAAGVLPCGRFGANAAWLRQELLLESGQDKVVSDWSADGRFILYYSLDPQTSYDIWALRLEGDRKPFVLYLDSWRSSTCRCPQPSSGFMAIRPI